MRHADTLNATERAARKPARASSQRGVKQPSEEENCVSERIVALEAELALYRSALESTRAEMQAFAYSVSHDLRAPIRAIEGFSKILIEDFGSELSEEGQRFLKHIVANTETISSQVEDLLRFYRIGKNTPNCVQVDSDAVCREAIAELPPGEAAHVRIPSALPPVFADPGQLRIVFFELLSNALKFKNPERDAEIEIQAVCEPNATRFCIKDHGIGFDPQYVNKLFQVFQKLHPVTQYRGNGIGLAIVKRIVQAHGGATEAEGVPGKGATFSFTLPVSAPGTDHCENRGAA